MKDLKIVQVKYYQGVMLNNKSGCTSSQVVTVRTTTNKDLVSIEKTEKGVLVITDSVGTGKSYTEVPFNNVAYINYEAPAAALETKATKTTK